MPGSVGRGWASWVVLAVLAAGPVAAQIPPGPAASLPPPSVQLPPPTPVPTPPPPLLGAPPVLGSASPAAVSAAGFATRPVDMKPLPGSVADQLDQEYEARRSFRYCVWNGTDITAFPNTLLWQPPLASPIEPRFQALPTTLDNYTNKWTLDTSIGNTVGLFRVEPAGHDAAYQLDLFAVVLTRLTPSDLVAADYRFGIPVTARWGPWHAKLGYEHTSGHLGDEVIHAQLVPPTQITAYSKDEVVLGLGRWLTDRLRLYGVIGYAARQQLPDPNPPFVLAQSRSKWRFSTGFEWFYNSGPTGWGGTPFVAANLDSRGEESFNPNVTAQFGWLWRNPFQRLASFRIFGEYYNGRPVYGQFYDRGREHFFAVGFAGDY
jgi:hypothetical protein